MLRRFLSIGRRAGVHIAFILLIHQGPGILRAHAQTTVTVTYLETNRKRTTKTNTEGSYTFTLLPVGRYSIAAEAAGFKSYEQSNVELQVEANLRIDFRMEVGQLDERVVITAEAPQVDTGSSALGKVVEEKRIVDLPLNGRNFLRSAGAQLRQRGPQYRYF